MKNLPTTDVQAVQFQEILRAARAGDNTARERLYLDYGLYFRRLVARRLREQHLEWATSPHDIFHAVLLRVWQENAMNSLRNEEEFLKYVSRAVEREVHDLRKTLTRRRRDYRRLETLTDDESRLVALNADPVISAGFREELESILSRLSEQNRQVLEMWLAGNEWDAIGASFGLGGEALRKRFHRSLATIRREFAEQ